MSDRQKMHSDRICQGPSVQAILALAGNVGSLISWRDWDDLSLWQGFADDQRHQLGRPGALE